MTILWNVASAEVWNITTEQKQQFIYANHRYCSFSSIFLYSMSIGLHLFPSSPQSAFPQIVSSFETIPRFHSIIPSAHSLPLLAWSASLVLRRYLCSDAVITSYHFSPRCHFPASPILLASLFPALFASSLTLSPDREDTNHLCASSSPWPNLFIVTSDRGLRSTTVSRSKMPKWFYKVYLCLWLTPWGFWVRWSYLVQ